MQGPLNRLITSTVTATLTVAVLLAAVGMLLRDRVAVLAILSYTPIPILIIVALTWDLLRRGRAWGRIRFGLAIASLLLGAWYAADMVGWRGTVATRGPAVRVLQWNVRWGGGRDATLDRYRGVIDAISAARADVIVLSEAPPHDRLVMLRDTLGPDTSIVMTEHDPGARYHYRLAVCSRWPVRRGGNWPIDRGMAMACEVECPDGMLRVLLIDGQSAPTRDRRRMLADVRTIVTAAAEQGRPFDLIAGDFNTPGRSIAFDGLAAAGYTNVAAYCGGWRATWPARLPLLDIDHIWIRTATHTVAGCRLTSDARLDHRGIVADLVMHSDGTNR